MVSSSASKSRRRAAGARDAQSGQRCPRWGRRTGIARRPPGRDRVRRAGVRSRPCHPPRKRRPHRAAGAEHLEGCPGGAADRRSRTLPGHRLRVEGAAARRPNLGGQPRLAHAALAPSSTTRRARRARPAPTARGGPGPRRGRRARFGRLETRTRRGAGGSTTPHVASSIRATSLAKPIRWRGCFASRRRISASRPSAMPLANSDGAGGSTLRCPVTMSWREPTKGGRPWSTSYSMQPSAYRSVWSHQRLAPDLLRRHVRERAAHFLVHVQHLAPAAPTAKAARPKSPITGQPSARRNTLDGLEIAVHEAVAVQQGERGAQALDRGHHWGAALAGADGPARRTADTFPGRRRLPGRVRRSDARSVRASPWRRCRQGRPCAFATSSPAPTQRSPARAAHRIPRAALVNPLIDTRTIPGWRTPPSARIFPPQQLDSPAVDPAHRLSVSSRRSRDGAPGTLDTHPAFTEHPHRTAIVQARSRVDRFRTWCSSRLTPRGR